MMMAIDDPPRWIENLLGLVARFSGLPIGCIARSVHRHPFSPVGPARCLDIEQAVSSQFRRVSITA
jgi:hypothetical protein